MEFKIKDEGNIIHFTYKNSKNQTVKISFDETLKYRKDSEILYDYWVMLTVKTKRTITWDSMFRQQTGNKTGFENLLIAKNAVKQFIEMYKEKKLNFRLSVHWDDNRRRNVYERGLKSLGFKFKFIDGYKLLVYEAIKF